MNLYVPATVGVPEIFPVEALRESPAGNSPFTMLHNVTVPSALSATEYACRLDTVGRLAAVVILGDDELASSSENILTVFDT